MKVAVDVTVPDEGLGAYGIIEAVDGVEKAGASSPHPTNKSKNGIKKTARCLPTMPLV